MKLLPIVVVLFLTGCAQMYAAIPYLPAAKVGYCAAADDETRQAIRERYSLPKVVQCPGD